MSATAIVVVFEKDIGSEDIERVSGMLRMIRGVCDVKPIESDINSQIAVARARQELVEKIAPVLFPSWRKGGG